MQPGVDAVEGVLETRARLLVDLAHRLLERLERIGEVGELAVEVFLALGLFLELVDGRQVHLAQLLEVAAGRQRLFPGWRRRHRPRAREDLGQLETRGGELLDQPSRRTRDSCAARRACFHRGARARSTRCSASRRRSSSSRNDRPLLRARGARWPARFDVEAARQEVSQLRFELDDRLLAVGQRAFELALARLSLLALVGHALEADAHRLSLERRDSMRISISRLASCAACAARARR